MLKSIDYVTFTLRFNACMYLLLPTIIYHARRDLALICEPEGVRVSGRIANSATIFSSLSLIYRLEGTEW